MTAFKISTDYLSSIVKSAIDTKMSLALVSSKLNSATFLMGNEITLLSQNESLLIKRPCDPPCDPQSGKFAATHPENQVGFTKTTLTSSSQNESLPKKRPCNPQSGKFAATHLVGHVVDVLPEKQIGFIKLNSSKEEDIFFHFSRVVGSGSTVLARGEIVGVNLDVRNRTKAQAFYVSKLIARKLDFIHELVCKRDFDDIYVLSLTSSPVFWKLISLQTYASISNSLGHFLLDLCRRCEVGSLRSSLGLLIEYSTSIIGRISDRSILFPLLAIVADVAPHRLSILLHQAKSCFSVDQETVEVLISIAQSTSLGCASQTMNFADLILEKQPLITAARKLCYVF